VADREVLEVEQIAMNVFVPRWTYCNMKQGLLTFFVLAPLFGLAQLLTDTERLNGDVMRIAQVNYTNGIWRDGWKSFYYFDNANKLTRKSASSKE
jgi:hypothetical protein